MIDEGLTTAEVAELLGVKKQTVYAYVSRGILHRHMAMDGRTSRFDRSEVEELRLGRRPEQAGEMRAILSTKLTRVADDGLWIRGQDLIQLVNGGAGFIEVADLLWQSPTTEHWPNLIGSHETNPQTTGFELVMPGKTEPTLLDRLRITIALESSGDPLRHDLSPKSVRAAGRRATLGMVAGLPEVGGEPAANVQTSIGSVLWSRLTPQRGSQKKRRALDAALALLADHGLAGSTFAARIAASVRADPYSVVSAGLGVVGGTLHGAASAAVHRLYVEADNHADAAAVLGERQRAGSQLPGFGHSVYRSQDPRYGALMGHVIEAWSQDRRLQNVFRVRDLVGERSDLVPNVDLALGALTYLAGMPTHAGEAIFAIGRTAGWLAHAMEEYEEQPLRFRPRARYLGPRARTD